MADASDKQLVTVGYLNKRLEPVEKTIPEYALHPENLEKLSILNSMDVNTVAFTNKYDSIDSENKPILSEIDGRLQTLEHATLGDDSDIRRHINEELGFKLIDGQPTLTREFHMGLNTEAVYDLGNTTLHSKYTFTLKNKTLVVETENVNFVGDFPYSTLLEEQQEIVGLVERLEETNRKLDNVQEEITGRITEHIETHFNERFTILEGKTIELSESIQWNGERITALEGTVETLNTFKRSTENKLTELETTSGKHENDIATLNEDVKGLSVNIEELEENLGRKIDRVDDKTTTLENKVITAVDKVETLEDGITALGGRTTLLEDYKDISSELISSIQKQLDNDEKTTGEIFENWEQKHEALSNKVASVSSQQETMRGDISTLSNRTDTLFQFKTDITKRFADVETAVEAQNERINGLETTLDELGETVATHTSDIAEINGDISDIRQKHIQSMTMVDDRLTSMESGLDTQAQRTASIETSVEQVKSDFDNTKKEHGDRITANEEKVEDNSISIDALKTSVQNIESVQSMKFQLIEQRFTADEQAILENKNSILSTQSDLGSTKILYNNKINNIENTLTPLEEQVQENTEKIASLEQETQDIRTTHGTRLQELSDNLTQAQADIDSNTESITELVQETQDIRATYGSKVQNLTNDLTQAQADIETNAQGISTLDTKIDGVESSLDGKIATIGQTVSTLQETASNHESRIATVEEELSPDGDNPVVHERHFEDTIEKIQEKLDSIERTDKVEEGSTKLVESGGVWNALEKMRWTEEVSEYEDVLIYLLDKRRKYEFSTLHKVYQWMNRLMAVVLQVYFSQKNGPYVPDFGDDAQLTKEDWKGLREIVDVGHQLLILLERLHLTTKDGTVIKDNPLYEGNEFKQDEIVAFKKMLVYKDEIIMLVGRTINKSKQR